MRTDYKSALWDFSRNPLKYTIKGEEIAVVLASCF